MLRNKTPPPPPIFVLLLSALFDKGIYYVKHVSTCIYNFTHGDVLGRAEEEVDERGEHTRVESTHRRQGRQTGVRHTWNKKNKTAENITRYIHTCITHVHIHIRIHTHSYSHTTITRIHTRTHIFTYTYTHTTTLDKIKAWSCIPYTSLCHNSVINQSF